ncbi:hypothetical protein [Williamsia sp. D3]|uniref:hypothetical protein n=1 Tax=Williamsia sp. D3 TaxID=1313067 RepID=UPI0012695F18|nr:hypothetical protein [Williamsia sp. D3]
MAAAIPACVKGAIELFSRRSSRTRFRAGTVLLVSAVAVATLHNAGVAGADEPTFPFDLPGAGSSDGAPADTGSSGSTGPDNPTPEPNTPGTGGLQLLSPNAGEPVLGVPIETLSDNPAASIIVNGEGMPAASDRQNLLLAVLDARTHARLNSGTAPNNADGVRVLTSITESFRNRNDTIVVVSGHRGMTNAGREPAVADLLRALGASSMSRGDLNRMEAGAPFSIVGKTGAPDGTAFTRVGADVGDRAGANITGLLRWSALGQRYDFTPPAPIPFTTRQEAGGGNTVTMTVGAATYTSTPSGPDGFVIRGFDSQTLAPSYEPPWSPPTRRAIANSVPNSLRRLRKSMPVDVRFLSSSRVSAARSRPERGRTAPTPSFGWAGRDCHSSVWAVQATTPSSAEQPPDHPWSRWARFSVSRVPQQV